MIIAFGDKKKVGKSSARAILEYEDQRVSGVSFAKEMKRVAHQLYGWAGLMYPDFYVGKNVNLKEIKLPKIGMSPRELWVKFGTEAVRNCVYQDTWVKLVECRLKRNEATAGMWSEAISVIDDMRFQNEFDMVKKLGGFCVRIDRPSLPAEPDAAEGELEQEDRWDYVLVNDGTLPQFKQSVLKLFSELCARKDM